MLEKQITNFMKAYFHNSYVLERDNISKILSFATRNPSASRREIAQETGIGIGKKDHHSKVLPTIRYAIYGGILNDKSDETNHDISFSKAGEIIFENDPRLKSPISQWVMHYFFCRPQSEAEIWAFFVHEFLAQYVEFDGQSLEEELKRKFPDLSERNIKENRKILTAFYTDANGLSKVGLIESYQKDVFIRGKINYQNAYLAAYILAEIWEAKHGDKPSVNPAVLLENGDLATTLNLNEGDLQNCLDEMSAIGAIGQTRGVPPFQVVRKWADKFDLLCRAFEVEQ